MPKRVIDFDAMWGSDKLAACAPWAQVEYAWLYGLADASGCFELTNLRVIWGRVAAIRANFTLERLEQVFGEFQDKGLLYVWEYEGKRYGHWTGSDVPGRLPAPSWRMRLEKFTPPVPKQKLAEYMSKFARGRAGLAREGFRGDSAGESDGHDEDLKIESSDLKIERGRWREDSADRRGKDGVAARGIKGRVEGAQGQDLDLGLELGLKLDSELKRNTGRDLDRSEAVWPEGCATETPYGKNLTQSAFLFSNSSSDSNSKSNQLLVKDAMSPLNSDLEDVSFANSNSLLCVQTDKDSQSECSSSSDRNSQDIARGRMTENAVGAAPRYVGNESWRSAGHHPWREKDLAVARELRVGTGPVCGPAGVKREVLERIRKREEARAALRSQTG